MSGAGIRARAAAFGGTPGARVLAIVLILGAATAAIVGAVVLDRPSSTTDPLDEPLTVKRALSTSAALFGDPIGAEIDVYTNDRSIAARSVRVSTDFKPYRVAATTVERVGHSGVSLLRTRVSLECLTRACLPPRGGKAAVRFAPFAVTYRTRGRDARVVVPWEPLQLSSRLPREATTSVGIIDTVPPLDPRFERSPETLRALFLLVAAVLGLAGAVLVITALWPPSLLAQRRWRRLSPLERSLLRLEAAARSDDEAARRRTLDDLATHLGEVPSPSLERRTRALAWGERPPEPETLTLLAEQVRTALNGGVRAR